MKNKILDAALSYVKQRHWKVFPARMEHGKKYSWLSKDHAPGGLNWGMSDDPEQLRKNFSNRRWRDRCGIGIPTGAVNKIFVLEVDTKAGGHAADGIASLRKLELQHGKLPKTRRAVSPSGSEHFYFRHPGAGIKIRNTASEISPGVDIRGDGGMVVAPPSRRGDGVYRWRNSLPIAKAPRWLLELVQETERVEPNVWEQFGKSPRQVDLAELTLATAMIPNGDCGWETWNRTGMALFAATGGGAEGFRLFRAWSHRSSKYDAGSTAKKWQALHGCPPHEIGAGTVFHLAEEAVPDWRERQYYDPEVIALIDEFLELMDDQ
jgi:hypothetical protein